MKVKTKLVASIAVLFFVIITIISLFSFINFRDSSVTASTDKLSIQATLASKTVEQKISRYFDVLYALDPALAINVDGSIDTQQVKATLNNIKENLNVLEAYVGLKSGDTYTAEGTDKIPNFNAKTLNREWYQRIFNGEKSIITTPYKSSKGYLVMALAIPVIRDNQIIAALCINLPVDEITKFVNQLSETQQIYVNRSDGFIIAAHNADEIGKDIFEFIPVFKAHQNKELSQFDFMLNNEDVFGVSLTIESLGWSILAWDTSAHILEASQNNLLSTSVISIVFIILSLGVSYFLIIKLMYQPIGGEPADISQLMRNISAGDLSNAEKVKDTDTGVYAEVLIMAESLRSLIRRINDSTHELTHVVGEVESSTSEVNDSSSTQMVNIEQVATAMNEMTMTVDDVAKNAVQASESADETGNNATSGLAIVKEMTNSIDALNNKFDTVVEVANNLEEETKGIGSILEVINSISEQTNLLALNAAIEAARAGEQGRGFAVVADEVRNLATKTKESTNQIQTMINRLQKEAKHSVDLMKEVVVHTDETQVKSESVKASFDTIKDSINSIQNMNSQIATAAEEQTHVAADINESVVFINDLAKITYQASENNKQVANRINNLTDSLKQSVVTFKL